MNIVIASNSLEGYENYAKFIAQSGHQAIRADDMNDFASLCRHVDHDLILICEPFRGSNEIIMIKALRNAGIDTPVLVVLDDKGSEYVCRLLSVGADDCVPRNIHAAELNARIRAVIRRSKGHAASVIRIGRFELNLDSKEVRIDGSKIELTRKEYQLIEALTLHKNSPLSKEHLMVRLYSGMDEPQDKIIDVFVCKARKKLRPRLGEVDVIQTVWGHGYMMTENVLAQA